MKYPKTRKECVELGGTWYFTGKPCKHGHLTVRHVTGSCYGCTWESAKKWQAENPERYYEYNLKWKRANVEKCREWGKNWKKKNPDRVKELQKKWKSENKQRSVHLERKRVARKLNAMPKWSNEDLIGLIYEECPDGCVVDHIIPLQGSGVCGLHVENNLQYLPKSLNQIKYNRYDEEVLNFKRY